MFSNYFHRLTSTFIEEIGNEYLRLKASILYAMVRCYGWSKADYEYRNEYDIHILEDELKKAGFLNTLAYYYLDICIDKYFDSEEQIDVKLDEIGSFKKTLNIARQLGNNNLIVEAYEKMIVIYSNNGKHEHVDYLYNKYVTAVHILQSFNTALIEERNPVTNESLNKNNSTEFLSFSNSFSSS